MQIYLFSEDIKASARLLVASAVAKKSLIPSSRCDICLYDTGMICEEESILKVGCKKALGKKQMLEAHHFNYNFPLLVWWLCPACHKMIHVIQRKCLLVCIALSGARRLVNDFRYEYEHNWLNEIDEDYGKYDELSFW